MTYNITGNYTHYADFTSAMNVISGGWIGVGILISIFFIALYSSRGYESWRSFCGVSFLTAISATYLLWLGWISSAWWVGASLIFLFSFLAMLRD